MSFHRASAKDFQKIPGSPVAYWASESFKRVFEEGESLRDIAVPRQGLATMDNVRFTRFWHEVSFDMLSLHNASEPKKWYPYNKGGDFRKWYGNQEYMVNWENNGVEIKTLSIEKYGSASKRVVNEPSYFKESVTWSKIGSGKPSFRLQPKGAIFDVAGMSLFSESPKILSNLLSILNSKISLAMLKFLSPTLNFEAGQIGAIACIDEVRNNISEVIPMLIDLSQTDWDNYETSWDFITFPLLRSGVTRDQGLVASEIDTRHQPLDSSNLKGKTLEASWNNWKHYCDSAIARMQELETENNRLWIDAYGLQDELTPEVPVEEITLARADRAKDMAAFLSYAVGCMMGRFSLEVEGLVLANSGETLADYVRRVGERQKEKGESGDFAFSDCSFAPDEDGIIPVLDGEWFADDVVGRTIAFLKVTFGEESLEENIRFIEDSLGKSLRKYFVSDFYKNHISNERAYGYKKRPIYWLVQSPKKSFQALIYLHRYTKDTMNLVLNNYLREYEAKLENHLEYLKVTISSESSSAAERTRATKETAKINASLKELDAWEKDTLFPIASQRIELDLDDGVKANYPKFGKVLAKIAGVS